MSGESLRERKKAETRHAIARAALELFAEHGYDHVTLAEIAAAAEIGERTLFRYAVDKEELLFLEDDAVRSFLVDGLTGRPAGEPAAVALREACVALAPRWQDRRQEGRRRQLVIDGSSVLAARERGKHAVYARELADALIARGVEAQPALLLAHAAITCQHQATLCWLADSDATDPGLEARCREAFTQLADYLAPLIDPTRGPTSRDDRRPRHRDQKEQP